MGIKGTVGGSTSESRSRGNSCDRIADRCPRKVADPKRPSSREKGIHRNQSRTEVASRVYKRSAEMLERRDQRLSIVAQQRDLEVMRECTFRPKTNTSFQPKRPEQSINDAGQRVQKLQQFEEQGKQHQLEENLHEGIVHSNIDWASPPRIAPYPNPSMPENIPQEMTPPPPSSKEQQAPLQTSSPPHRAQMLSQTMLPLDLPAQENTLEQSLPGSVKELDTTLQFPVSEKVTESLLKQDATTTPGLYSLSQSSSLPLLSSSTLHPFSTVDLLQSKESAAAGNPELVGDQQPCTSGQTNFTGNPYNSLSLAKQAELTKSVRAMLVDWRRSKNVEQNLHLNTHHNDSGASLRKLEGSGRNIGSPEYAASIMKVSASFPQGRVESPPHSPSVSSSCSTAFIPSHPSWLRLGNSSTYASDVSMISASSEASLSDQFVKCASVRRRSRGLCRPVAFRGVDQEAAAMRMCA